MCKMLVLTLTHFTRVPTECVFFSGVYSWLVMTFNYLILWVRVKGQG